MIHLTQRLLYQFLKLEKKSRSKDTNEAWTHTNYIILHLITTNYPNIRDHQGETSEAVQAMQAVQAVPRQQKLWKEMEHFNIFQHGPRWGRHSQTCTHIFFQTKIGFARSMAAWRSHPPPKATSTPCAVPALSVIKNLVCTRSMPPHELEIRHDQASIG